MFDQVVGLKKRYRDGEQVLGVSLPAETTKDRFDEILSADSYDYVSVDSQHSPYNEDTLAAFCDMAADADVFVQFRIKHTMMTYLVGNLPGSWTLRDRSAAGCGLSRPPMKR